MDKDGLVDLQDEVRYLLNAWDPIGIYDKARNFPPDEYDCFIAPLLLKLEAGEDISEISQYLWFELEDHFGLDPVGPESDAFARKLVAWWRSQPR